MDDRSFDFLRDLAGRELVRVRVRGNCMDPVVRDGELVSVRRRFGYLPGDVVVFRLPGGGLAAHRLIGLRPHQGRLAAVTKGDHCSTHDGPLPFDSIIGSVADRTVTPMRRLHALGTLVRLTVRRIFR